MNDAEWTAIAAMLGAWWPGEWTDQLDEGYRLALDSYLSRSVAAVLENRLNAGVTFRPPAGEIVRMLRGGDAPSWATPDQAWALIEQAIHKVGRSIYAKDFPERHQAAIDWLAQQDEVVAAYAARRGLAGYGSLGMEPVGGEYGTAVRGRIAKEYREHVADVEARVARGLPAVESRQLLVRGGSTGGGVGMAEVLEGLRPARELGDGSDG